jgi:hypothetical protein
MKSKLIATTGHQGYGRSPCAGVATCRSARVRVEVSWPKSWRVRRPDLEQAEVARWATEIGASSSQADVLQIGGGPRWTRTTYLRVISTALCQLS